MYSAFYKENFIIDKLKYILSSKTIYIMAIALLVSAFSIFSLCIDEVSRLIVVTSDLNIWNICYTVIEFILGLGIVSVSVTMIVIKANVKKNLDKSIKYIELLNVFVSVSIVLATFFIITNGIKIILENIYLYNIAKNKQVVSLQKEYIEMTIFDIFILCIIMVIIILTTIKLIQFLRGIEVLNNKKTLNEKGVSYLKVMSMIMSIIFVILSSAGLPVLFLNSEYEKLTLGFYYLISICLTISLILFTYFIFRIGDAYKQIRNMLNNGTTIAEYLQNNYNIPKNYVYTNNNPINICPQCRSICRIDARFCGECGFPVGRQ